LKPEDLDELSQHYAQGQVIHGGADVNAVDVDAVGGVSGEDAGGVACRSK
jgi:hypothetical protein